MSAATASAVEAGDSRVQETLKEFVQADLRLKAVIAGVQSQSGSEQRCHSLRELVDLEMEARTSTKQMRQLLAKLEHLASEEDNDIARAAFMRDVENYAAQLHQSQVGDVGCSVVWGKISAAVTSVFFVAIWLKARIFRGTFFSSNEHSCDAHTLLGMWVVQRNS